MSHLDMLGAPLFVHLDGGHHIQAEQGHVRQILLGEMRGAEMGVYAAQAAQPIRPGAGAAQLGNFDMARVADNDVADHPSPIDEEAHLAG